MKISEIQKCTSQKLVSTICVLANKQLTPKSNGGNYLNLSFCDATGKIDTPIWDNCDELFEQLQVGKVYKVSGMINIWNGNVQIKNLKCTEAESDEYSSEDLISSYDIKHEYIDRFNNVIQSLDEPYKIIVKAATGACGYDNKRFLSFLKCPSAEKHHGNKIGGLFLHTYFMMLSGLSITDIYNGTDVYKSKLGDVNSFNISRFITKIILHDIMKQKEYEYSIAIRRKPNKMLNHLIQGVGYLEEINSECGNVLSEEDVDNIGYAILSHHGQYGPYEPKSIEDILLHLVDMVDAKIVGEIEK